MKTPGKRIPPFTAVLAALVSSLFSFQSAQAGIWVTNGSMTTARYSHTATLLQNGKVLATGGGYNAGYFSSTELYNPAAGTWTAAGSMATNRALHTATLLPNGKVLVAGGLSSQGINNRSSNGAELFDPTTGTWQVTGALATARYSHTATLLPDGKVLVAGGNRDGSNLAGAELYDPTTGTWTSAGSMTVPRSQHTATLLANGKVLIAGGVSLSSAELYDPASGTWTPTGSMSSARRLYKATLLSNGKVLVAGGFDSPSSSETYDPASGTWTAVGSMATGRYNHAATLLPDGRVLVSGGGVATSTFTDSAELYQPGTGTWLAASPMGTARGEHSATLLSDTRVLVAGGRNRIGSSVIQTSLTQLYVKAPATVTLDNLLQIYDGTARSVTVTTAPPDLTVDVTYNGSIDAPTNPGTYTVVGTILDLNYFGGTTNSLLVGIWPVIQSQPASRTNNLGTTATFNVAADETPPFFYQWRKDGIDCSAVSSPILTLTNVQKSDEGLYSVAISNVFGGVVSADAQLTVNLPPIADTTATLPLVISVNGSNATVVLDGSRSHDPDGDSLQYTWFSSGSTNSLTNGVVAVVLLPLGTNSFTLTVSDGLATDSQMITLEVLTPDQAISRLIDAAADATAKRSLLATLRAALAAVDRSNPTAAVNQLQAFQNQVSAQLGSIDPETAQALIDDAQLIIDAITRGTTTPGKVKITIKPNGKSHLNFSGMPGQIYVIEVSYDLVNWEIVGVATDQTNGDFKYDDNNEPTAQARFYRVAVPEPTVITP